MPIAHANVARANEVYDSVICWRRSSTLMNASANEGVRHVAYNNRKLLAGLGQTMIDAVLQAAEAEAEVWYRRSTTSYNPLLLSDRRDKPSTVKQLHRWEALVGERKGYSSRKPSFTCIRRALIAGQQTAAVGMEAAVAAIGQDPAEILPHMDALFVPPDPIFREEYGALWLPDVKYPMPQLPKYAAGGAFHPIPVLANQR